MKVKIHRISGVFLYVMLGLTLVVACLFYFGGEASGSSLLALSSSESQPAYTDVFLYWLYVLFGIIVLITVAASVFRLIANVKDAPLKTVKSLSGIFLLLAVLLVSWWAGSNEPLALPGYAGAENTPFWSRIADMFLYSIYVLAGTTVGLILAFAVVKRFK